MIPHLQLSVRVCFVPQCCHLFQFNPSVRASPSGLTQHLTYNLTNRNQSPSPLESKHSGVGPALFQQAPHPTLLKYMLKLTSSWVHRVPSDLKAGAKASLQGWCWPPGTLLRRAVHKPTAHRTNLLSIAGRGGGAPWQKEGWCFLCEVERVHLSALFR